MSVPSVRLYDPDVYQQSVPHEFFTELRRSSPVYWQPEEPPSKGFWAVTRHADVVAVSRDAQTFSSYVGTTSLTDFFDEEVMAKQRAMMVNLDAPEHTRQRNLVNRGFTPRMVSRLEPRVRAVCESIMDSLEGRTEVDFVHDVAAQLPLAVIAELMGAPPQDSEKLFDWSNRMIGFDDPEFQTTEADGELAAIEIFSYANEMAEQRRSCPRDDIVTKLLQPDSEGDVLSEMEFNMFFVLLVVAGNETTRNAATGGMHALLENRDQYRKLVADPGLAPKAVEEILRWVSPVMDFRRTATRDTEIGGQPVKRGDKVVIFYPSANRDEAVFDDPHTFDIERDPNPHIAFGGGGPHYCLGTHLARLELRVLFETIAQRLPDMELVAPPRRLRSNFINGIKEMRVKLR
ncbi:cytochrome P450 [Saccharomonospora marina XMU15]|uniref:Cytochrome P450 n=1 Tax=Saccharomonospora marina XMU15 TaxID=882083 RepID=H5XA02_9PSEU|nr:cytochrome P450 [Saccharomonospora marina]EHR53662.1 cytochrome P450 [Saccharomonospora marina XMU15]